jgi:hypothetical protein
MDSAVMSVGHGFLKKVHPGPCAIANSAISSWPANSPVHAGGFIFCGGNQSRPPNLDRECLSTEEGSSGLINSRDPRGDQNARCQT